MITESLTTVRALQPGPKPHNYLQGYCALRFSALCAWKGYAEGRRTTEWLLAKEVLEPGMTLHTTYTDFTESEKNLGNETPP